MSKLKMFITVAFMLSHILPLANAAPLELPKTKPPELSSTIKGPSISPLKVGPMKLGPQFIKRPTVDNEKNIKGVGFGLKFSFAI